MSSVWRKRLERLAHDTAVHVIGGLVVAALSLFAAYSWRGELARWFRGREFVENWAIAATGLLILGLLAALAVYVRKYRARCARDYWLSPPWVIRDTGIGLEWRLRRRPDSWTLGDLDTQPTVVNSIIQGPFHSRLLDESGEPCLEPLMIQTDDGAIVATACPRCSRTIYDDREGMWGLVWLKTRTLKSLRRDVQNGKRVRSGYSGDFVRPFVGD